MAIDRSCIDLPDEVTDVRDIRGEPYSIMRVVPWDFLGIGFDDGSVANGLGGFGGVDAGWVPWRVELVGYGP